MGKAIIITALIGFILFGIVIYKIGKNENYHRPCGGGRHHA